MCNDAIDIIVGTKAEFCPAEMIGCYLHGDGHDLAHAVMTYDDTVSIAPSSFVLAWTVSVPGVSTHTAFAVVFLVLNLQSSYLHTSADRNRCTLWKVDDN